MKERARFYEKLNDKIHCKLCPHNCVISEGNFGKCKVRTNEGGELYTINYGEIACLALDPIEKKPINYFMPGTYILSAGSFGCNFTCDFCQNHEISQIEAETKYFSKEKLVERILETKDNIGIAFTYNEPSIWYEYAYDCAKLLKEKDASKKVVLVTNGYINEEPLKEILPYVDAMNIDLKGFSKEYYREVCGGTLEPVLRNIELAAKSCHVEVTTLLVTDKNDNLEEVEEIAKFLSSIDKDIPLHLSRYFPMFKLHNPPTDLAFMRQAGETARKYLNRVVLGNIWED